MTYSVFCFRFEHQPKKIIDNLSLEDAKKICNHPDTSSTTTKDWKLLKKWGKRPWFYGYTEN